MRRNGAGFLLFEFMLYLFLAIVIASLTSYVAVTTYTQMLACTTRCAVAVAASCALDVLVRDLRQAPAERSSWKSISDGDYVWHTPQGDLGWQLRTQSLVRTSGIFDSVSHEWQHATHSVIMDNVVNFVCECTYKNSLIEHVVCILTATNGTSVTRYVTLSRGILV